MSQGWGDLLTLHCEILTDLREMAFVQVPVTPELWETAPEELRERLRDRARTELRHAVTSRGRRPLAGRSFNDAPVWVERAGECVVECVGGPMDGARVTTQDSAPPPILRVVPSLDWSADLVRAALQDAPSTPVATYGPMTDAYGFFARAVDDGAWRYEFRR